MAKTEPRVGSQDADEAVKVQINWRPSWRNSIAKRSLVYSAVNQEKKGAAGTDCEKVCLWSSAIVNA